jgi:hypothetical protein
MAGVVFARFAWHARRRSLRFGTVHFRGRANPLFSVNAATAATNLNVKMVNARSMWLKLPVFWQKNAV